MELRSSTGGELLFRGPTRSRATTATRRTRRKTIDAEGWVRTGDIVLANADGTISFVGRLKDMLKVGGENVSAAEIEGYLLTHPAVGVAAVVAAPDARYGEVPAAYVRLGPAPRSEGGADRLLHRADRDLQGAALRALRGRVPAERVAEDPQDRAARAHRD